jgi:hypothetical protein
VTQKGSKRKLCAILSADVQGYSRLMGEDEDATVRTLTSYRELMSTIIQKHRGRVVDSPGDNLLAEFLSVVEAVRCAVEIQEEFRVRNAELSENSKMEFRVGATLGTFFNRQLPRSVVEIPYAKPSPSGPSWPAAVRDRARLLGSVRLVWGDHIRRCLPTLWPGLSTVHNPTSSDGGGGGGSGCCKATASYVSEMAPQGQVRKRWKRFLIRHLHERSIELIR